MSLPTRSKLRLQSPPSDLISKPTCVMKQVKRDEERIEKKRKYSGPVKGSQEAKDRMAKVRAAQWAKNGLVVSNAEETDGRP